MAFIGQVLAGLRASFLPLRLHIPMSGDLHVGVWGIGRDPPFFGWARGSFSHSYSLRRRANLDYEMDICCALEQLFIHLINYTYVYI